MTVHVRSKPPVFNGVYYAVKLIKYGTNKNNPMRFFKNGEVFLDLENRCAIIYGKRFDCVFYFDCVKLYKQQKNEGEGNAVAARQVVSAGEK